VTGIVKCKKIKIPMTGKMIRRKKSKKNFLLPSRLTD
jgi:hypothetical protein